MVELPSRSRMAIDEVGVQCSSVGFPVYLLLTETTVHRLWKELPVSTH